MIAKESVSGNHKATLPGSPQRMEVNEQSRMGPGNEAKAALA